jgi:hypothetical protein
MTAWSTHEADVPPWHAPRSVGSVRSPLQFPAGNACFRKEETTLLPQCEGAPAEV